MVWENIKKKPEEMAAASHLVFVPAIQIPALPALKETWEFFQGESTVPILQFDRFSKVGSEISRMSSAVVVACISVPDDLMGFAELAGQLRAERKSGRIVFFAINRLDHQEIETVLVKLGCAEVLPESIKAKALGLKLIRHLALARLATMPPKKPTGNLQESDYIIIKGDQPRKGEVVEVDALAIADDCWLVRGRSVKYLRELRKWLITFMGPDPTSGEWVKPAATQRSGVRMAWEWRPRDPANDPFVRNGRWLIFGHKPEFKDGIWVYVSEQPELAFYSVDNYVLAKRFYVQSDGALALARNSEHAIGKLSLIDAALERTFPREDGNGRGKLLAFVSEDVTGGKWNNLLENELADRQKELEAVEKKPQMFLNGSFGSKVAIPPERIQLFKKAREKIVPKAKLFQEVEKRETESSYMRESVETQSPITLWTAKQAFRGNSLAMEFIDRNRKLKIHYPEGVEPEAFRKELTEQNENRLFLNVNLKRTSVFLSQKANSIELLSDGFAIELPKTIYEIQRRNGLRIKFGKGRTFDIYVGPYEGRRDPKKRRSIKDFSAGGCAFYNPNEAGGRRYRIGDTLPNISFEIYGKWIHAAGQVRWARDAKDPEGRPAQLVGVQFIKLDPFDLEGIHLFVMEEHYQYLKKYLDED